VTTWIQPSDELASRISMPSVPLPVRDETAAMTSADRIEPGVIATDVADWLAAGFGTPVQRKVMARYVAALAYVAGFELLDRRRSATAAEILSIGVRHAPDDPSLRAMLAISRWDSGHRTDALGHLAMAVDQYAAAGQTAPMLNIITAQVLSAAGRHADALGLLEVLAATEPGNALFWDLIDAVRERANAA
jgi:predicted Zn-dependent protease